MRARIFYPEFTLNHPFYYAVISMRALVSAFLL